MQDRTLILMSGGLDSTVLAHMMDGPRTANVGLFAYYGQKHTKEVDCAKWQASKMNMPLMEVDLGTVFTFNPDVSSLLMDSKTPIVHEAYFKQANGRPVSTYVPFRNGLLLSYATAVALQIGCNQVAYAAHADDAAGSAYPDCSISFAEAMNQAIRHGTSGLVTLYAPFIRMSKADIVKIGVRCGVDFSHTWSCYEGNSAPCGACGTCIDRRNAFIKNGLEPR